MSQPFFIFVVPIGNNELFNKSAICYCHYLKSILNDSFKEYINPVVFINFKYML